MFLELLVFRWKIPFDIPTPLFEGENYFITNIQFGEQVFFCQLCFSGHFARYFGVCAFSPRSHGLGFAGALLRQKIESISFPIFNFHPQFTCQHHPTHYSVELNRRYIVQRSHNWIDKKYVLFLKVPKPFLIFVTTGGSVLFSGQCTF